MRLYMGKSVPSPGKLQEFARIITSNRLLPHHDRPNNNNNLIKPIPKTRPVFSSPESSSSSKLSVVCVQSKEQQQQRKQQQLKVSNKRMGENSQSAASRRIPLADVVAECVKRWFQDTLKEAKAGDTAMQVLVAQMYNSGYGVPSDVQKGKAWMNKATRSRSSAWKITDKRPGYNASDSDSEDADGNNK